VEHDRPSGGEPGDRAAAARHRQQLHVRLHHRVLDGQLHVSRGHVQPAAPPRLPSLPHLHPLGADRRHVLDLFLDQTRGHPRPRHPRSHLAPHTRYILLVTFDWKIILADKSYFACSHFWLVLISFID